MHKKFMTSMLVLGSMCTGAIYAESEENLIPKLHHHHHDQEHLGYAVLSNQAAVTNGDNILWAPFSGGASSHIGVDGAGNITLDSPGKYIVQYTVRVTRSPFNGTAVASLQLQQTVGGVPTNINTATITNATFIDGVTNNEPQSDTQITAYAFIEVTGNGDKVINLRAVFDDESNLSIPAASGLDANAQMIILQVREHH
jgi:hypothetical protein